MKRYSYAWTTTDRYAEVTETLDEPPYERIVGTTIETDGYVIRDHRRGESLASTPDSADAQKIVDALNALDGGDL